MLWRVGWEEGIGEAWALERDALMSAVSGDRLRWIIDLGSRRTGWWESVTGGFFL